ncbi:MAG: dockerin type I domain-containing protein [Chthoniobacterales bacterium]
MKTRSLPKLTGALLPALIFSFATLTQAAPGDLDPTFGGTGAVRAGFGGGDDRVNAVAIQTDDKVVVAGYAEEGAYGRFLLVRYNVDGSLDGSFGVGGKVLTFFAQSDSAANAITVQADGKLIAAGSSGTDFAIARYNPDGSLDSTFGLAGKVITDFPGADAAHAVGVLADGKILVAGASNSNFAIARYDANGALDTSFGAGGKVTTSGTTEGGALFLLGSQFGVAGKGSGSSGNGVYLARYNGDGSLDASFGAGGRVFTATSVGNRIAVGFQPSAFQDLKIVVATGFRLVRYNLNGSIDTTFGSTGIVTAGENNSGIAFQTSFGNVSRILVSGSRANPSGGSVDFILTAVTPNGALDTTFGSGGTIYTPVGAFSDESHAMRTRSGKIVVAGSASSSLTTFDGDVAVVRYNFGDGSLDPSFDGDGKRLDDFGNSGANPRAVALQADGKIVLAGETRVDFGVMRFNPDGSLDPSFSGDGRVTTEINGSDDGEALALQADGKIVVAGSSGSRSAFALTRYNPDGSLDATFNGGGKVTTTLGATSQASGLAIQADGKIVAAGSTGPDSSNLDFALVRYLANGAPDSAFGTGGRVITGIVTGSDQAATVQIQPDGKILAAGYATVAGNAQFAVVRYNPNGSLDLSFGSFGIAVTDFPGEVASIGINLALQTDGKIVVAGYTVGASQIYKIALVRYLANGSLDSSFDGDGRVTTQIGVAGDYAFGVAVQPGGKILIAGTSIFNSSFVVNAVRYNPNGSLDASFGIGGRVLVDASEGSDGGWGLALDSAGRAVIAAQMDGLFGVVRLQGDGGGAPAVMSAVSRKVHGGAGTFDIDLPLTGTPGLECRSAASYQVVVGFAGPVTLSGFTVSGGASPGGFSVNGSEVTLDVVPSGAGGKRLVITLQNVTVGSATGNIDIPMNLLLGDTTGNGTVNASDIGQTKAQSGQVPSAGSFRTDVNVNGVINASDIGLVKSNSGSNLP